MAKESSKQIFMEQEPLVPRWVEHWVKISENAWRLPGTNFRVGLDSVVGFLLPGFGDWITAIVALAMIGEAGRRQVPVRVLIRMLLNVALDTVLGSIPILGDVYDTFFRSNTKNLELLRRHARPLVPVREAGAQLALAVGLIVATLLLLLWLIVVGLSFAALWAFAH